MNNINELTAKLKAAALKAKVATEDYAAGRISITTCYSECAEFNSLTDGPDQILPLTEALEAAEKRIAELDARTLTVKQPPFGYLRVVSGQAFQIMEGPDRPADRSGDCVGPWFAIWTAAPSPALLTVKLPEPKNSICSDWNGGFESAMQLAHDRIKLACAVAGIKLQIEGE